MYAGLYLCRFMSEKKADHVLLHWIIFTGLALTWGSSFILMKRGLEVFSSNQVAALRLFIAFLFVLPLSFRYLRKDQFQYWTGYLGSGVFGSLIPAFLFTAAETGITSSLTGMLNSLTPVFTLLVSIIYFRSKPQRYQVIGLIIGLAGAVGLMLVSKDEGSNTHIWYSALVVIATLCYGISVNIIRSKLGNVNAVAATIWMLLFVGPLAGIYLFTTDFVTRMQQPLAWQALGYVAILAIFGTALSVIVYNLLIKQAGILFAASVTYAIPIVAVLWGVFEHEAITLYHVLFIAVILCGVWLVTKK
jgi:drug/metabolite transporter (DMT)-like permease